jgi:hypothetical protein
MSATEDPWLLFFRRTPRDLARRPGLGSSLQSFETTLFLIALMRYPHALAACTFAIESALKTQSGPSERGTLQQLLAGAQREFPRLAVFPTSQLDDLRTLRNRIVHRGFHASDDPTSARALLSTALPFLASLYEVAFGFDVVDALVPPFGVQLKTAIEVFNEQQRMTIGSVEALSILGHLTRWSFRMSWMAPWERQALDASENYDLQFEVTSRLRARAERELAPAWSFDCPVCEGPETLVCRLDDDLLEERRVEVSACYCVECGLRLSQGARQLVNAVCSEMLTSSRDRILSEFGIE